MSLERRSFLGRLAFTVAGFLGGSAAAEEIPEAAPDGASSTGSSNKPLPEGSTPGRLGGYIRPDTIEVVHKKFDLIVVGGGISGTCAAISAARNGMKVALVHERSTLGGNSSSEVRLYPEDTCSFSTWSREPGILDEIYTEERARNWEPYIEGMMNSQWDLVLYEWARREKNLTLLLNTTMREVEMADASRILGIHAVQLGTEKEFLLEAPLFIDATGDGVLIYRSGAQFRWGKEARSEYGEALAPEKPSQDVMGNTVYFRARNAGHPITFKKPEWAAEFPTEGDLTARNHGFVKCGYWWIEVGYPKPLAWIRDNEEIRDELLRQLLGVWDHIKNRCNDDEVRARARNYALEFIGFWPYKRESRRLLSDYVLREKDVRNPRVRPDDIAYGVWGIDIHVPGGILEGHVPPYPSPRSNANFEQRGTLPYGIPFRSCYSKNVVNLLAAGRPIGASYVAFASSRVLATGAITGQGVGAGAALCKKHNCHPRQVAQDHAEELQQLLLRQDASIPGVDNRDPADLARSALVTASSESPLRFPESREFHPAEFPLAQIFPVSSTRLERIELLLKSSAQKPVTVKLGLRKAAHVWDFRSDEKDLATASALLSPGQEGYVPFVFHARTEPGSLYYLHMEKQPEIAWALWSDVEGQPALVPVGVTPADRPGATRWRPITNGKSFSMRITPEQYPYPAANIVRGTNRPDRWTNIWISDPNRPLPAWIELKLPKPAQFNSLQITFDNNINVRPKLPLFRFPDCVKSYEAAVPEGSQWKTVVTEKDNYFRRAVHTFPRVRADRLRITIQESNGTSTARIYEVRIYNE